MATKNENDQFRKIAKRMGDAAIGAARSAWDQHEKDIFNEGCSFQRDYDIESVITMLLDLKYDDFKICTLLSKYFNIKTIDEASELILEIKVFRKLNAVTDYLIDQGYTRRDANDFIKHHQLREALKSDTALLKQTPEKIIVKYRK